MTIPSAIPVTPSADTEGYLPLSALNDLLFCPRRCYLHRTEGVWTENAHTAEGSLSHRRVHRTGDSTEGPHRTARGLWLVSHRMRLVGVADSVEFHRQADGSEVAFPVEYKNGRRKRWDNDDVQLCAQAICLEEMTGWSIPAGAIFHRKTKRRRGVIFDDRLRSKTLETADRLPRMLAGPVAPPPVVHRKCGGCSLNETCMPVLLSRPLALAGRGRMLFSRPTDGIEGTDGRGE